MKALGIIYLTPHFKLAEFLRSNTADSYDLENIPDWDTLVNINHLAHRLEDVRKIVDLPIIINSGYRSSEVNAFVCGSSNSFHLHGRAADIRCADMQKLRDALGEFEWNEYIDYSDFIHIAL